MGLYYSVKGMFMKKNFLMSLKLYTKLFFSVHDFLNEVFITHFFKFFLYAFIVAFVSLFAFGWNKLGKIVLTKLIVNIVLWVRVWASLTVVVFFIFTLKNWFKLNIVKIKKKFKFRKLPPIRWDFGNLVYICTTWKTDVFSNRTLQSIIITFGIFLIRFALVVTFLWYDCYDVTLYGFRVGFDQAILLCLFSFLVILILLRYFLILKRQEEMLVEEEIQQAVEAQRKLDRKSLWEFKMERARRHAAGLKINNYKRECRFTPKKK